MNGPIRLICFLLSLIAGATAFADDPPAQPLQYSCEHQLGISNSTKSVTMKLYVDHSLLRQDLPLPNGGVLISIIDTAKQVQMTYKQGASKVYVRHSQASSKFPPFVPSGNYSKTGEETIGAEKCSVWTVVTAKGTQKVWFSLADNHLVQVLDGATTVTCLTYTSGAPDPAVFKLPPNATIVQTPDHVPSAHPDTTTESPD